MRPPEGLQMTWAVVALVLEEGFGYVIMREGFRPCAFMVWKGGRAVLRGELAGLGREEREALGVLGGTEVGPEAME